MPLLLRRVSCCTTAHVSVLCITAHSVRREGILWTIYQKSFTSVPVVQEFYAPDILSESSL